MNAQQTRFLFCLLLFCNLRAAMSSNWEGEILMPWLKPRHDHNRRDLCNFADAVAPRDEPEDAMAMAYPFPSINRTVAPAPSGFFEDSLRVPPIPTNAAWENFVLKAADQPEYFHPYSIKSHSGSVSISYPNRAVTTAYIFQAFVEDLTVSCATGGAHQVHHYDDLTVTLKLPGPMIVPLARGSPYVTFLIQGGSLRFSTIHAVLKSSSNSVLTKHKVWFNNNQIWVIYSSKALYLDQSLVVSEPFKGVLRIALLSNNPDEDPDEKEKLLDRSCNVFPLSGTADLSVPFRVVYRWRTHQWGHHHGDLLMLSHAVHSQILVFPKQIQNLTYRSIDGELVGVSGDTWVMQENDQMPVGWYSYHGFQGQEGIDRVKEALLQDVAALSPIQTVSTYYFGKALARAARLALIAEEIHCFEVLPQILTFLADSLNPWLNGTKKGNALVYDTQYGGLISQNGAQDSGEDFGLGVYNDHHYHFGYFCYGMAVLAKFDPIWANQYRLHAYAIVKDFLTVNPKRNRVYTKLRCFDLWKMHSWASGLTEFADGRNQESSSEAVNAYYSAALLAMAYGDFNLMGIASTLLALEIRSAKTFWQIPSSSIIYEEEFVQANRILGIVWGNKRDTNLWWATGEWRECRMGIQLIPLLPISQTLFSDEAYVQKLVEWTLPSLQRAGATDGWRGFVYALQAVYDKDTALENARNLTSYDDGNSLTNLLWWFYTRPAPSGAAPLVL